MLLILNSLVYVKKLQQKFKTKILHLGITTVKFLSFPLKLTISEFGALIFEIPEPKDTGNSG